MGRRYAGFEFDDEDGAEGKKSDPPTTSDGEDSREGAPGPSDVDRVVEGHGDKGRPGAEDKTRTRTQETYVPPDFNDNMARMGGPDPQETPSRDDYLRDVKQRFDSAEKAVREWFTVERVSRGGEALRFQCSAVRDDDVEKAFATVRLELKKHRLIPMLRPMTAREAGYDPGVTSKVKDHVGDIPRSHRSEYSSLERVWAEHISSKERCTSCGGPLKRADGEEGVISFQCERCGTPRTVTESGRYLIQVIPVDEMQTRSTNVNLALLILTVISTTLSGAMFWGNTFGDPETLWEVFNLTNIANGALYFSLPLMTILGIHELGHYFMAKRHGVDASLPFFIPVPPLIGIIGTFGAFINMREPIPNKKALFDIGIAGPVAGFITAIPVVLLGIYLTATTSPEAPQVTEDSGLVLIGLPIFFQWIQTLTQSMFPSMDNLLLHPTAFAGWVGLLLTGLNLLPIGQLDGGHISRALLGEKSHKASLLVFFFMIILGSVGIPGLFAPYSGWLIFGFFVLFLGTRHPPPLEDVSELGGFRKVAGVMAVGLLLITFVANPLTQVEPPDRGIDIEVMGGLEEFIIVPGETGEISFRFNNTGEEVDSFEINITLGPSSENRTWSLSVANEHFPGAAVIDNSSGASYILFNVTINSSASKVIEVELMPPGDTNPVYNETVELSLSARSWSNRRVSEDIEIPVRTGTLVIIEGDVVHGLSPLLTDGIIGSSITVETVWNITNLLSSPQALTASVLGDPDVEATDGLLYEVLIDDVPVGGGAGALISTDGGILTVRTIITSSLELEELEDGDVIETVVITVHSANDPTSHDTVRLTWTVMGS